MKDLAAREATFINAALEERMTRYEIRIIKPSGKSVVLISSLASDFAAIRRAQSAAAEDDQIEIWRSMTCIYMTDACQNRCAA